MSLRPPARLARAGRASAVLVGLVAALIAWSPVLAAVSWGTTYRSSQYHVYETGNALGRTVLADGTSRLHEVYMQYQYDGVNASDSGPYQGIYYRRGSGTGSSWGTPTRLNSTTRHGEYATLDTTGKYVYVAWRQQPHATLTWNGVDPRPLKFRRNTNHGAGGYWSSPVSFLGADRIDRPSVAATGARVWVAYTDAIGGAIRLQRSSDYGKTFTYTDIGATTRVAEGGYFGQPMVAATGSTIAVAWDNGSTTWVKISTDAGATWKVDEPLAGNVVQHMDMDGASGRVVIAWGEGGDKLFMRRWNGSTLAPKTTVVSYADGDAYRTPHTPAVALSGTSVIGIAYTACSDPTCTLSSTSGASILWIESRDGGATWGGRKTVGSWKASSTTRENEWPSAVWGGSTRRSVMWQAWAADGSSDRLLVRSATGTP